MDRRKRTGVALAAGLLFLFVTEILLLFLAGNSLYKEEQGKLGALVLSHPEQETEYIELFDRGKQRNRQEEEAGKELEERYGYTPRIMYLRFRCGGNRMKPTCCFISQMR